MKFLITEVLLNLKFLIPQIISPHQHGFLKHRSVETNLFEFVVKMLCIRTRSFCAYCLSYFFR